MKKLILFITAMMLVFASCEKEEQSKENLVVLKAIFFHYNENMEQLNDSATYTKMNGEKIS